MPHLSSARSTQIVFGENLSKPHVQRLIATAGQLKLYSYEPQHKVARTSTLTRQPG
eukprot:m.367468 g.367468  ORF g.367468 m.367468 type:complete len:56 (-) comp40834_c0_seq1:562-729(-)